MISKNHNLLNGNSIAINEIASCLGKKNNVYVFDVSKVNYKIKKNHTNYINIKKKLSLKVLFFVIRNSLNVLKLTFRYLNKNPQGIFYYFSSLFNVSMLKASMNEIKPDTIHFHGLVIEFLPILAIAEKMKIPYIITIHGLNSLNPDINLYFKKEIEKEILVDLYKKNRIITTVSKSTEQLMISEFDIPSEYIKIIHNGVNTTKFNCKHKPKGELRNKSRISKTKIVLIQVGTLVKVKNHITILKAISQMKKSLKDRLIYLIIGDGPEKSLLKSFCKDNNLEKQVIFIGNVPHNELNKYYCLSDFLILPSTSEGFPLVILEAISAGLPVITFLELGGVKEIYNPIFMKLIPERTTEAIIKTIENAINTKWDRKKICNCAKMWDWVLISEQYMQCYQKAIKDNI